MKNPTLIILSIIALILIVWGTATGKDKLIMFKNTDVACLPNGHQSMAVHIHPHMRILVDDEEETIPANIGILPGCMSETHTHDETGTLHIESADAERIDGMHLGHFFSVWERNHMRDGYSLEIMQDGETKNTIEDVILKDRSQIELRYTSE